MFSDEQFLYDCSESLTTEYVLRGVRYSDGLWAGGLGFDSRQWQEIFLHSTASRTVQGPTPALWVLETLPGGISARGVKLTAHLYLVSR
jgi:hypothetical protein